MKVAYVCNPYHWNSYSILRTLYEELLRREEIETVLCKRPEEAPEDVDQIWIFSSTIPVVNPNSKFMVVIGSAEPDRFLPERFYAADLYATWSAVVHKEYPSTLFLPLHADKRYFKPLDIPKEYDCVFLGTGSHPRIKTRRATVEALRERGVRVLAVGEGWTTKHPDNRAFVSGDELIRSYNLAHLALDLTDTTSSMSSRLFQAAMCAVPVLTMERDDTTEMFVPDREVFYYKNAADCVNRACLLLANKGALEEAGRAAYSRAVRCHDVTERLDVLLQAIKERL